MDQTIDLPAVPGAFARISKKLNFPKLPAWHDSQADGLCSVRYQMPPWSNEHVFVQGRITDNVLYFLGIFIFLEFHKHTHIHWGVFE